MGSWETYFSLHPFCIFTILHEYVLPTPEISFNVKSVSDCHPALWSSEQAETSVHGGHGVSGSASGSVSRMNK